jgi:hypothetical protein
MRGLNALLLGAIFVIASPVSQGFASPEKVGAVDKVQGDAEAAQADQSRSLAVSGDVLFLDRIQTGDGARLEATLNDGAKLTLGEHGHLIVDKFVYDPAKQGGALSLRVKGAFLFVGGKIEGPTGGDVSIKTPIGTLGVRGTTVWGGPIDGGFGVLVLKGEVWVKTKRGTVDLKEGSGTMIFGAKAPEKAAPWPADRTKRAVATISFGQ